MKALLQLFTLIVGLLVTPTIAEDCASAVSFEDDPKTIDEFSQIVQEAARKGEVRVRFRSGEWNWYGTCQNDLVTKEKFAEWSLDAEPFKQDDLGKWLTANKIAAVQISMAKDCDPGVFFEIEAFLRKREIIYWVQSAEISANQKKRIRLLETDGIARPIPPSDEHPGE